MAQKIYKNNAFRNHGSVSMSPSATAAGARAYTCGIIYYSVYIYTHYSQYSY